MPVTVVSVQPQYFQELKKFLADPKPEAEEKPQDAAWSDEPSEVAHLTDESFDSFLASNPSVLVNIN